MNEQNHPLRVSHPADILAYLPHTLGFEPRESMAFLTLHGAQLGALLRVDLPAAPVAPASFAQTVASYLLADEAADAVLLIIYTNAAAANTPADTRHGALLRDYTHAIEAELEEAGLGVRDGWLVTDRGWQNYFCTDPGCCTLHPLSEIRDSALNAELIYRGSAPVADPAADPAFTGGPDNHATIRAAAGCHVEDPLDVTAPAIRRARAAWCEALGTDPENDTACQLVGYLHTKALRDRIMADTITGSDDPATYAQVLTGAWDGQPDWARVDATEALLTRLLARTPAGDRAPLFSFLGWLCWYKGRSSVAHSYCGKALTSDPGHRLAHLMGELITRGALPYASTRAQTSYGHHFRNNR